MKDNIEIHPSKIKSVRLLKVSNLFSYFWERF